MRVNSACSGFFSNRFVTRPGIAAVLLAIFSMASSFTEHSDRYLRARQVNLIIRQIGHRLLLQAGDSTSRILPVTEVTEGTFLLRFDNAFVFNHDSLLMLSRGLLPKIQFASGYTVTVHDCIKGDIVYGFQINNTSPDILACSGRSQPAGCYTIEFAFADFYKNITQKTADINRQTKPIKVDPREDNTKNEELKTTTFSQDISQRSEARTSAGVNPALIVSKPQKFKTETFNYPLINVVSVGMLVLLGVMLFIWRRKIFKSAPLQHPNNAKIAETAALGNLLFDEKGQRLLLGSEEICLTDKECKVLGLLHKNYGELILRETLMQEVWLNEGVITGRSLDMFISKLRRKLSVDPDLRITNIHGKGYRLETVNDPARETTYNKNET